MDSAGFVPLKGPRAPCFVIPLLIFSSFTNLTPPFRKKNIATLFFLCIKSPSGSYGTFQAGELGSLGSSGLASVDQLSEPGRGFMDDLGAIHIEARNRVDCSSSFFILVVLVPPFFLRIRVAAPIFLKLSILFRSITSLIYSSHYKVNEKNVQVLLAISQLAPPPKACLEALENGGRPVLATDRDEKVTHQMLNMATFDLFFSFLSHNLLKNIQFLSLRSRSLVHIAYYLRRSPFSLPNAHLFIPSHNSSISSAVPSCCAAGTRRSSRAPSPSTWRGRGSAWT